MSLSEHQEDQEHSADVGGVVIEEDSDHEEEAVSAPPVVESNPVRERSPEPVNSNVTVPMSVPVVKKKIVRKKE